MIIIRLSRVGAKNRPLYRIVATEKERKGTGKHIEILGHYDPYKKLFEIDKEKYNKWISYGAQVSASVNKLLNK